MLIQAAHYKNRYLTFKSVKSLSTACSRNDTWLQKWLPSKPDAEGYCFIESVQKRGYFLISPNIKGKPASLGQLKKDNSLAKWKLVNVHDRYLGHPNLNYQGCVFLMSRLIPLPNNTTPRATMKEHELGVANERTDDGAPIILWDHQGVYYAEPGNQIWLLENA